MDKKFKIGDIVCWNTLRGPTKGEIIEIVTSSEEAREYNVKASVENPKYKIRTLKTKKIALHNASALTKYE